MLARLLVTVRHRPSPSCHLRQTPSAVAFIIAIDSGTVVSVPHAVWFWTQLLSCRSALGILKWRMQNKDEGALPITFSAWPSQNGNQASMNIECAHALRRMHTHVCMCPVMHYSRMHVCLRAHTRTRMPIHTCSRYELQNMSFEARNLLVSIPSPDAPSVQQASGNHRCLPPPIQHSACVVDGMCE